MNVEINGLDEILKNLQRLNVDEALENRALTKAGKITKEAILKESKFGRRSRGVFKKNLRVARPKDGEVVIHSGGAYHAHLIEFGRSAGSAITKQGKKVYWGRTAPNPVFGRGFESSKNEAKQAMADELRRGLGL